MTDPASIRYAYFARGIDGFYLNPGRWGRGVALVREGTPELTHAQAFLPSDQILTFRLRRFLDDPYPSTEQLLQASNISTRLKRAGINHVLLSSSCTAWMHDWSIRHGITFLATPYRQQVSYENKIWFDRFLARYQVQRPQSQFIRVKSTLPRSIQLPVVVQRADSLGGEGTFFVHRAEDWPTLTEPGRIPDGERCLVRQWIRGESFGITLFISPERTAMSAIRLQCYHESECAEQKLFAGVQWIKSKQISESRQHQIKRVLGRLAQQLQAQRFSGFANVDFIIDRQDQVWIIECNPRMSAATPQLLAHPELSGGVDLGTEFLAGCLTDARSTRGAARPLKPRLPSFPPSSFAGATLDILPRSIAPNTPRPIVRSFPSGRYSLHDDRIKFAGPDLRHQATDPQLKLRSHEFCVYTFAQTGQLCHNETALATLLSPTPLYDRRGQLNTLGRQLLQYFNFVDAETV